MSATQAAFKALADPTRRGILTLLRDQNLTIGEVSDAFPMTRAAVKKHLSILEAGNLIQIETRGRERINRINPTGLRPVLDWIAEIDAAWDDRLAALKSAIEGHAR